MVIRKRDDQWTHVLFQRPWAIPHDDYQARYDYFSTWAELIAFLILVGLAVDIAAVFILRRPFLWEGMLAIAANSLIALGVYGELLFARFARRAGDHIVADAQARIAEANQQAATANERTAELKLALEKERQKRLGRVLTKEQFEILLSLRGMVSKVYVTCERDPEALFYSAHIATALSHAGIQVVDRPPGPNGVGSDVQMVLGPSWSGNPIEHPLAAAFMKASLIRAGIFDNLPSLNLDAPLLLVGRRMPEFDNPYFPPRE